MKPTISFTVPAQLLGTQNPKTIKSLKQNVRTWILYMAPHTQNSLGVNLCSHATNGCASACLFKSGFGGMYTKVEESRINKSNYFLADRKQFMLQLVRDIKIALIKDEFNEFQTAIRLNGTTDIAWEKIKIENGLNIFEMFPNVQFYDYTKNPKRFEKILPTNYSLTFSRSENNDFFVDKVLANGGNVAVVFETVPEFYKGFKVINGDKDDLRYKDEKNVVVGLKYKKLTYKGANNDISSHGGFVIPNGLIKKVKLLKVA